MITPSDSPSAPAQYGAVAPHGQGTAPYDVQAPLEDLGGSHPLQVRIAAGMDDDGDHGAAMGLPAELTDGDARSAALNIAPSLLDDGSPG